MPEESALAIRVPAAEPVVGKFRAQYDPSAAEGVPAHVTVLYPFMPPTEINDQVLTDLSTLFLTCPAFSFVLNKIQTFPEVLYLAPNPEAPFRELIERVIGRFPDYPPYGGIHTDIIPHLTVGHAEDPETFAQLRANFSKHVAGKLPILTTATAVTLIEIRSERWQVRWEFPLGAVGAQ
jgi:hypothetical protein